jgi:hypothetical protein
MRTRPLILVTAGVVAIGGLASGTASAASSTAASATAAATATAAVSSASSAAVSVAPAQAAAHAAFNASAWAWGTSTIFAYLNAKAALNAQYTGCTNIVLTSSRPSGSGWIDTVEGTCTGTA